MNKFEVVVLCGIPGSGKSTTALSEEFKDYVRVNQDELFSKDKCVEILTKALKDKQSVIVDRCNQDIKQRKLWIDLAYYYGAEVRCSYLVVNPDTCLGRIYLRKNHPTIKEGLSYEKKRSIIASFLKSFQDPTLDEGFKEVVYRRND